MERQVHLSQMSLSALTLCLLLLITSIESFASEQSIRLYNWEDYMPESVLEKFYEKSGYKVEVVNYETDDLKDELITQTGGKGLDLIIGSGASFIAYVKKGNILTTLDESLIPNQNYISNDWKELFPELKSIAIPYLWGTLGIAYRKDKIRQRVTSWKSLIMPEPQLKGKIMMINDARDAFVPAFKLLGLSANESDSEGILAAGKLLANQRDYVDYGYVSLSRESELITGKYWMTLIYNGDALTLQSMDSNIEYVVPEEGSNIWMDSIGILQASQNKKVAHEFINFINQPEIAKEIAISLNYATPNSAAEKLLPKVHLENPAIYPDQGTLARSEIYKNLKGRVTGRYNNTFMDIINK